MLPLTDTELDALRELANVGAGHGAVALSRMLGGERVGFEPPAAREVTESGLATLLGGEAAARVVAEVEVLGAASAGLWLVLEPVDAEALARRLAGRDMPGPGEADAALAEVARALALATVSAMGRLTGLFLEPAPAALVRGTAGELARDLARREPALALDVHLRAPGASVQLLLLPRSSTLGALLRALRA
ncbi:MAG TPA: fibril biogenesis regulator DifG [Myxococcaceae bacterium]|nr:fibril biogenesis regulator DifG [Myxococcaceae bacterium]